MRMRQSIAEIEEAFHEEVHLERSRRESLSRTLAQRSRARTKERVTKRGNFRFAMLVFSIIATAVVVTFAMFETIYVVLG